MDNTTEGNIAILVLFYNKLEQTKDCINSFLPSGEKIYVLNNGSPAADFLKLKKTYLEYSTVQFYDAGENLGPAGGRNFLINKTKEPWIICVDNDITIEPKGRWKDILQGFLNKNPQCEIVCPRIYNVHEHTYMQQLMLYRKEGKLEIKAGDFGISNFFPEGGVILSRTIFEKYGLYDEEMFAFEGYEFSLRAMLSVYGELKAFHMHEIELVHDHRFQQKSTDKDAVKQRYNEEKLKASYNRLISKYGIDFEHDWQWWSKKQVEEMTKKKWGTTLKKAVKGILGR